MSELEAGAVMVILFALRCIVPALLMIGFGYLMNWLVDKWRAEDEKRHLKEGRYCPAYFKYGNECWSIRMTTEGALPAACVHCPIYVQAVNAV